MEEKIFYNSLAVVLGGDVFALGKMKRRHGTWKNAYRNIQDTSLRPTPDPFREWEKIKTQGIQLILYGDPDYPPLLREIPRPPFGIYVKGDLWGAEKQSSKICGNPLAIVGTRRATADGIRMAEKFGGALAAAGFPIVSGLAFGIDAAAHEGCLSANGHAIAVLAGGLDSVYPHSHAHLARRILAAGGALISEYPVGPPAYPARFIERNRIISGLSQGTIIIEAPAESGALATARTAAEAGRDVFVVPGQATHPNFTGSHTLIRQGAELTTSPDEILEAYGLVTGVKPAAVTARSSPEEIEVLQALAACGGVADVDKISTITKLEPRIVSRALSFLLIRGVIRETTGGYTI